MHNSVSEFVKRIATRDRITGKRVLEVGSYNVNGSLREMIRNLDPAIYHGIDLFEQEDYVDEIMDASDLLEKFGPASWDVVLCCEVLEHAEKWEEVIRNIKGVLAPGACLCSLPGVLVSPCTVTLSTSGGSRRKISPPSPRIF